MRNDQNTTTATDCSPLVFRQLANPKKWTIYQYLGKAKFATVSITAAKCQVEQSLCSRYLRDLAAAGLVMKVRIGTVRLYEINQRVWRAIGRCLKTVEVETSDTAAAPQS